MNKFRYILLVVIGLLCNVSVSAELFVVNGLCYKTTSSTDMTVEICNLGAYQNALSGAFTIPESVVYNGNTYRVISIANWAFTGCYGLTSVKIPNSVTSIGSSAFDACTGLTSVEIPNSVTSIGNHAFCDCSSLTSVEIPNSVTSIGYYAFYGCSSLIFVEIPNSVTSIGNFAFYNCSSLTSVEIPNSVTSIGDWAFCACSSLTSVEIGNSVTSIGDYAFYVCSSVNRLSCYAEVPPTCGYLVFSGIDKEKCVLQVPGSSLAAYRQADQWKDFLFIEDVLTSIGGVTVGDAVPATADVYSTNGMLIKRNAELKHLKHHLPAGIYIIGGKKVLVK